MNIDLNMAIAEYTNWHRVSALVWMLAGSALLFIGGYVGRKFWPTRDVDDHGLVIWLALGLTIIGSMLVAFNIPTAANPRAYAIHTVLKDSQHHFYNATLVITNK